MPVIVEDHSFVLGGFPHADAILLGVFNRRIKELCSSNGSYRQRITKIRELLTALYLTLGFKVSNC